MPILMQGVGDTLTISAGKYPKKTAIIDYSSEKPLYCSYENFNSRVNKLANGLVRLGIEKNQKVAFLFYNSMKFLECYYAIAKIGAVGIPLNYRLTAIELSKQISHSDAVCIIFDDEFNDRVNYIKLYNNIKYYITASQDNNNSDYETLIKEGKDNEPNIDINLYDDNVILYTAGTTGNAKGVVLTHKNSLFNALANALALQSTDRDVVQVIPPLFHAASLNNAALRTILTGGTLVIHKKFDPKEMLEAIKKETITIVWGPFTLWNKLIKYIELINDHDTSSVRLIGTGAQVMPASFRKNILSYFPNAGMTDLYGLTEASPCVTILMPEDVMQKPDSVGRPLPICEVKIMKDGLEALPLQAGEIITRGNFMKCYYKNHEETEKAINNGWLYTGDIGCLDNEGFLYILDRKKDIIISGGENIYSKEVEDVLSLHPEVFEVAVVGLPDETWGNVVAAFIVPKSNKDDINKVDMVNFCKKYLASYKCPKIINIVDNLPKNPVGKILKNKLRIWKQDN